MNKFWRCWFVFTVSAIAAAAQDMTPCYTEPECGKTWDENKIPYVFTRAGISGDGPGLWTGYVQNSASAGVMNNGQTTPYASLYLNKPQLRVQAGFLEKSLHDGLLLSNGGYNPGYSSEPAVQPFGFGLQKNFTLKGLVLEASYRHYRRVQNLTGLVHIGGAGAQFFWPSVYASAYMYGFYMDLPGNGENRNTALHTVAESWLAGASLFYTPESIRSPLSNILKSNFDMFRYARNGAMVSSSYSPVLGYVYKAHLKFNKVNLGYKTGASKIANSFGALIYEKPFQEFSLYAHNAWFKCLRKPVSFQAGVKPGAWGSYAAYKEDGFKLLGLYYLSSEQKWTPRIYAYVNPDNFDAMFSIGLGFASKAGFSLVFLRASKNILYPLDPAYFPAGLYEDNLRGDMRSYFSGIRQGAEFFYFIHRLRIIGYALAGPKEDRLGYFLRMYYISPIG